MPLHFVLGTPGSGKSYWCVKHWILDQGLRSGRKVITNIPLNVEYLTDEELDLFEYRSPGLYPRSIKYKKMVGGVQQDFTVVSNKPFDCEGEFLCDEWRDENGQAPLYVIDECQELLAREVKPSIELLEFIAKHRHFGEMDIILISQGVGYIAQRIRINLETTTVLTKRAFLGYKNSFNLKVYGGQRERGKPPVTNRNLKYDKSIFKVYKSHTESKNEVQRSKDFKGNPFLKWMIRIVLFVLVLGLYTLYKSVSSINDGTAINTVNVNSKPDSVKSAAVPKQNNIVNDNSVSQQSEFVGPTKPKNNFHAPDTNINYYRDYEKRDTYQTSKDVKRAPFLNYRFSVVSSIESDTKKLYMFKLVDESRGVLVNQTNNELEKLGYKFEYISPCVVLIDHLYENNAFYATCEDSTLRSNNRATAEKVSA
ncbi:zonular occludens toxin domain-containing protein [Wohlfahrtiimonas larvae]|uniref:Zona occludens toxin N-terminal domain-containing protein n=1 Tax=Wohlfahrtiimonas larvae TaxID=1157986 RepID=A0ABP9MIG6_9GAMM|nr:zonular occludens toxin domain-containing protein [Wohlfahrtiimonas larvae]